MVQLHCRAWFAWDHVVSISCSSRLSCIPCFCCSGLVELHHCHVCQAAPQDLGLIAAVAPGQALGTEADEHSCSPQGKAHLRCVCVLSSVPSSAGKCPSPAPASSWTLGITSSSQVLCKSNKLIHERRTKMNSLINEVESNQ